MPLSYTQLQEAVVREAENRRNLAEPPILLEEELLDLAKSCPDNDIRDTEELALGLCPSTQLFCFPTSINSVYNIHWNFLYFQENRSNSILSILMLNFIFDILI